MSAPCSRSDSSIFVCSRSPAPSYFTSRTRARLAEVIGDDLADDAVRERVVGGLDLQVVEEPRRPQPAEVFLIVSRVVSSNATHSRCEGRLGRSGGSRDTSPVRRRTGCPAPRSTGRACRPAARARRRQLRRRRHGCPQSVAAPGSDGGPPAAPRGRRGQQPGARRERPRRGHSFTGADPGHEALARRAVVGPGQGNACRLRGRRSRGRAPPPCRRGRGWIRCRGRRGR